jgi:hypothetical protein
VVDICHMAIVHIVKQRLCEDRGGGYSQETREVVVY